MSFRYNWQWTFKVNELVPALERKLVDLRKDLEEAEKLPEDTEPEEVKAAKRVLRQHGLLPIRVREKDQTAPYRREIVMAERLLWLLKREDPHRQYKLDWEDVNYFANYIAGESNAD